MAFAQHLSSSDHFDGLEVSMNANGSTASFRNLPMAPKLVPTDLPTLQSAGRVLADQFAKDAQTIPDLGDMLTIRTSLQHHEPRLLEV